ncbi:MAG TPA: PCP reductase family protein [Longimicrobiales bacterium]|jgi:hypothetical protein
MKFLCVGCDQAMAFAERQLPGDGTLTAIFTCPGCGREVAMLANPMETQLVSSLGVEIGGRTVPAQPMEQTRSAMDRPNQEAFRTDAEEPAGIAPGDAVAGASAADGPPGSWAPVTWSEGATERLGRVPNFVRGMVKRIYADYAQERGIEVITEAVMDRARSELGLEGM